MTSSPQLSQHMTSEEILALETVGRDLVEHAVSFRREVAGIVKTTVAARNEVLKILREVGTSDATSGIGTLSSGNAAACTRITDRLMVLNGQAQAIFDVHTASVQNTAQTAFELALLEERLDLNAEEKRRLGNFSQLHRATKAEWYLYSGLAVMQVQTVLLAFNQALCAYLDRVPGKRFDIAGAGKEVGQKLKDALEDGLTFPGYSKLKKVLTNLLKSPATKQIE